MTWTEILAPIKSTEYFKTLWEKVKNEYATTKVFPPKIKFSEHWKLRRLKMLKW
jgi:uracil DNA glycosylase